MDNGELGRKLMEIRRQRGLTQRSLTSKTPHVSAQALSRIERGEAYPTLLSCEELSKALRCRFTIDPLGTACVRL